MRLSALVGFGLLLGSLYSTAPALAADWMSAPEIKRELIGTKLAFRGRILYREDGRMRMVSSSLRQLFGEWRIDEGSDSLCSVF